MKNKRGITLIALVITIIVLIILAGVAISLTVGENGIITRTKKAKLDYEIAQAKEELDLKIAELQTEKQGTATLQDVVEMLKNETDMDYIVSLTEIASITGINEIGNAQEIYVLYKIYQFKIDKNLKVDYISTIDSKYNKYEQLVNYTMLYDGSLGESGKDGKNLMPDITGGWKEVRNANATYNANNVYLVGNNVTAWGGMIFLTNSKFSGYKTISYLVDYSVTSYPYNSSYGSYWSSRALFGISYNDNYYIGAEDPDGFIIKRTSFNSQVTNAATNEFINYNVENCSNYQPTLLMDEPSSTSPVHYIKLYEAYLTKEDNWRELCTISNLNPNNYEDENELCDDSIAINKILSNNDSVEYMIKQCTGSFMNSFIQSDVAINEYKKSIYKSKIDKNKHWAKFISIVAER